MSIVIKTIGGRAYRYEQTSKRVNGKVVTTSFYIGPVNPRRPRKDGVGFFIMGGIALGLAAAKGELKPHKADKVRASPHPRSAAALAESWKPNTLATIQLQAREAGKASMTKPTKEDKERVKEMKAFNDRLHAQAPIAPAPTPDALPSQPSPTTETPPETPPTQPDAS